MRCKLCMPRSKYLYLFSFSTALATNCGAPFPWSVAKIWRHCSCWSNWQSMFSILSLSSLSLIYVINIIPRVLWNPKIQILSMLERQDCHDWVKMCLGGCFWISLPVNAKSTDCFMDSLYQILSKFFFYTMPLSSSKCFKGLDTYFEQILVNFTAVAWWWRSIKRSICYGNAKFKKRKVAVWTSFLFIYFLNHLYYILCQEYLVSMEFAFGCSLALTVCLIRLFLWLMDYGRYVSFDFHHQCGSSNFDNLKILYDEISEDFEKQR